MINSARYMYVTTLTGYQRVHCSIVNVRRFMHACHSLVSDEAVDVFWLADSLQLSRRHGNKVAVGQT